MAIIVADLGTTITGNSNQPRYENKVAAIAIKHEIQVPLRWEGEARMKGGSSQHGPITITRYMDKSSPKICETCSSSSKIDNAKVLIYQPAEDGTIKKYMVINLRDVYISRVETETQVTVHPQTGDKTEVLLEHVSLNYGAIQWSCHSMQGTWDISTTKTTTYTPEPEPADD